MANQVIISNDVQTLGPDATEEDIERYRAALQTVLTAEFGETYVYARTVPDTTVLAGPRALANRVFGIEAGDEWQALAFG